MLNLDLSPPQSHIPRKASSSAEEWKMCLLCAPCSDGHAGMHGVGMCWLYYQGWLKFPKLNVFGCLKYNLKRKKAEYKIVCKLHFTYCLQKRDGLDCVT